MNPWKRCMHELRYKVGRFDDRMHYGFHLHRLKTWEWVDWRDGARVYDSSRARCHLPLSGSTRVMKKWHKVVWQIKKTKKLY